MCSNYINNTSISLTVSIPALASYISPNFNSPLISSDEEVEEEDESCDTKIQLSIAI